MEGCSLPAHTERCQPPVGEQQRRKHHVSVEHHAWRRCHLRVLRRARRANPTASSMSRSCKPSSASFARTASARWIRTGVSTITPSLACTSKYSTGPSAVVMALGSVSWFLAVILASMAVFQGNKEFLLYHTDPNVASA